MTCDIAQKNTWEPIGHEPALSQVLVHKITFIRTDRLFFLAPAGALVISPRREPWENNPTFPQHSERATQILLSPRPGLVPGSPVSPCSRTGLPSCVPPGLATGRFEFSDQIKNTGQRDNGLSLSGVSSLFEFTGVIFSFKSAFVVSRQKGTPDLPAFIPGAGEDLQHQSVAIVDAEFLIQSVQMGADGVDRDVQADRRLFVTQAAEDVAEDVLLTRRNGKVIGQGGPFGLGEDGSGFHGKAGFLSGQKIGSTT